MTACSKCGGPGPLFTNLAFCAPCRSAHQDRMELLHGEAQRERIARENAMARHPSGRVRKVRRVSCSCRRLSVMPCAVHREPDFEGWLT